MSNIAFMAIGSVATLAYQKYNKQVYGAMRKTFNKTLKKADDALDDLM